MSTAARGLSQRAVLERAKTLSAEHNRSMRSRLVLASLLRQCGQDVSLVTIHNWSRRLQGDAYLWAIAYLAGIENLPQPWGKL